MDENDRIISSSKLENEVEVENILRPKTFDDFVGQEKVKENLRVYINSSKVRNEPLDHVLLYGPPGLGKTTISRIISNELNVPIRVTSGPAIVRAGDIAAILTNLTEGEVLFIDEIHRLPRTVEEILYPAMEDFALDIILGKGPSASTVRLDLNRFTLIGATTKAGMLTSPLRDRFGVIERLELYDLDSLVKIVSKNSKKIGIPIVDSGAEEIARRSRGTPRIANRLLKRVRDFAIAYKKSSIDKDVASLALNKMEIDELGLDHIDVRMLTTMIDKFDGGPVGLSTIAASINEDMNTIEDVYEPYLLQIGFIARTGRGRIVLPPAYKHLGIKQKKILSLDDIEL